MTTQTLLSIEQFAAMPESKGRSELLDGAFFKRGPTTIRHGRSRFNILMALNDWIKAGAGGEVSFSAGFVIRGRPNTVRTADVAYIADPTSPLECGYCTEAPRLFVDVTGSDADGGDYLQDKIWDIMDMTNDSLFWIVSLKNREVYRYTNDPGGRRFTEDDVITDELLPGLVLPVATIFSRKPNLLLDQTKNATN